MGGPGSGRSSSAATNPDMRVKRISSYFGGGASAAGVVDLADGKRRRSHAADNDSSMADEGVDTATDGDQQQAPRKRDWAEQDKRRLIKERWLKENAWLRITANEKSVYCVSCAALHPKLTGFCDSKTGIAAAKADTIRRHVESESHKQAVEAHRKHQLRHYGEPKQTESITAAMERVEKIGHKAKGNQVLHVFKLLKHSRPMSDYEHEKEMAQLLGVPIVADKHWTDDLGWEIAACIEEVLLEDLIADVKRSACGSVMVDDSSACDKTEYMSVELQYMLDGTRQHAFVKLQHVPVADAASLYAALMDVLTNTLQLSLEFIRTRLVGLGTDGASVNTGSKTGLAVLLRTKVAPLLVAVHCFGHRADLAVSALSSSDKGGLGRLEETLQHAYNYFSRSPKRAAEFKLWQQYTNSQGLRILAPYEVRWLSVMNCLKNFNAEYLALVTMLVNKADSASSNLLEKLVDIDTVLSSHVYSRLLHICQILLQRCQAQDVCYFEICNHLEQTIKQLQAEYCDENGFQGDAWLRIKSLGKIGDSAADSMLILDDTERVCFNTSPPVPLQQKQKVAGDPENPNPALQRTYTCVAPVSGAFWFLHLINTSDIATKTAKELLANLGKRFPPMELMEAFAIFEPQFWLDKSEDALANWGNAKQLIEKLKTQYGREGTSIVDNYKLDAQAEDFKVIMEAQGDTPTKLAWQSILSNSFTSSEIGEFCTLAQVLLCIPVGSVQNERAFSQMNLIKTDIRNRLGHRHLNAAMRVRRSHYTLSALPVERVVKRFLERKSRRGVNMVA